MITKTKLLYLASFAGGALIGSAVTWRMLKKKYEKLAQEEIDSVIDKFSSMYGNGNDNDDTDEKSEEESDEDEPDETDDEPESDDVYDGVETGDNYDEESDNYGKLAALYNAEERNLLRRNAIKNQRPYPISYEEYGELKDYEAVTLYYYADEVLAFESGEPIGNIDDVVGLDAIDMFGDYGENTVFVRNDRLKTDYEIIQSLQLHSEQDDDY